MKLVQFTRVDQKKPIFVNPDLVSFVQEIDDPTYSKHIQGKTEIFTEAGRVVVNESLDTVKRWLTE